MTVLPNAPPPHLGGVVGDRLLQLFLSVLGRRRQGGVVCCARHHFLSDEAVQLLRVHQEEAGTVSPLERGGTGGWW